MLSVLLATFSAQAAPFVERWGSGIDVDVNHTMVVSTPVLVSNVTGSEAVLLRSGFAQGLGVSAMVSDYIGHHQLGMRLSVAWLFEAGGSTDVHPALDEVLRPEIVETYHLSSRVAVGGLVGMGWHYAGLSDGTARVWGFEPVVVGSLVALDLASDERIMRPQLFGTLSFAPEKIGVIQNDKIDIVEGWALQSELGLRAGF